MTLMKVKTQELASRYIQRTEHAFEELEAVQNPAQLDEYKVNEVIEEADRYLEDAKYYLGRKRLETSLASVAYCEGLLDALRMLGFVQFSW